MDLKKRTELLSALMEHVLKKHGIENLPHEEVAELRGTLSEETDRGCALMVAAYIDYELGKLIKAHIVDDKSVSDDLFSNNGPLGTFSSRINLAYSLGLIPNDIRRDLHLLRKIRNEFAHNPKRFGFEKPEIKSRCNEFKFCSPIAEDPRERFISAMMGITGHIHGRLIMTKHLDPMPEIDLEKQKKFFEAEMKELFPPQDKE